MKMYQKFMMQSIILAIIGLSTPTVHHGQYM